VKPSNAQRKEKISQRYPEDMPANVRGRMLRNRMAAEWQRVLDMLEKGRKDPQGRTITEVWADMVLADPPAMFALVASEILPKEQQVDGSSPSLSIQQLYLTAVQSAQNAPNPRQIEAKPLPDKDDPEAW
jgi:hypothetical protein